MGRILFYGQFKDNSGISSICLEDNFEQELEWYKERDNLFNYWNFMSLEDS